jgi:hypothetical protein
MHQLAFKFSDRRLKVRARPPRRRLQGLRLEGRHRPAPPPAQAPITWPGWSLDYDLRIAAALRKSGAARAAALAELADPRPFDVDRDRREEYEELTWAWIAHRGRADQAAE